MDTVQDGILSKVFIERELVPMIYCHGLTANRVTQSVTCRDFASHGFLIFSIDHFDGTAQYARKQNGEEKYWSSMHDVLDKKLRQDQLEIRIGECINLIDEICEDKFAQDTLGFLPEVKLGIDKISMGGHSFGGVTAIATSARDERIKATFGMDPWTWAINEDIDAGTFKLKQPQLYLVSEGFTPDVQKVFEYDTIEYLKKIQETCECHKTEMLLIKDTHHLH